MKKTIYLMLATLLIVSINSCSKDSSSPTTSTTVPVTTKSVSLKIDGVQKNFSKVEVAQTPWTDNGINKVDLNITAINPDDDTEFLVFGIGKGDIGDGQLWNFVYVKNSVEFNAGTSETGLHSTTSINIEKRIQGTFNASVSANGESHTITEGIFDIAY